MSGGSYDYAYSKVQDFANSMMLFEEMHGPDGEPIKNPKIDKLREQFREHLLKVAEAMRMIEWVDSGDCSPGDEHHAIRECL